MKTSNLFLTSVAALALTAGGAMADAHTGTDTETDGEMMVMPEGDQAEAPAAGMEADTDTDMEDATRADTDTDADTDAMAMPETDQADAPVMDAEDATDMAATGASTGDAGGLYANFADSRVADLVGMNVLSTEGNDVGEVDNLVRTGSNLSAIVGMGGFLGLGEHDVAIPLDRFQTDADGNLVIDGLTEEELEAMPEWDQMGDVMPLDAMVGESY